MEYPRGRRDRGRGGTGGHSVRVFGHRRSRVSLGDFGQAEQDAVADNGLESAISLYSAAARGN